MNVLFLIKYESYKQSRSTYDLVKKIVERSGHEFVSNIKFAPEAAEKPEDYAVHIDKLKKSAEVIIADINDESTGIGHDIEWAIINKKPSLVFYQKENTQNVSVILRGKKEKMLSSVSYTSQEELEKELEKFLMEAKQKIDTKFILIISPEIDRYLNWAADYKRMHKAQVVRNAVEDEMENDEEYKKYLTEQ